MITKMTVSQYAKLVGVKKDTIHKRMNRLKADGKKLKGVTKAETSPGLYKPSIILHVDVSKVSE